jgi:hypothetical protein
MGECSIVIATVVTVQYPHCHTTRSGYLHVAGRADLLCHIITSVTMSILYRSGYYSPFTTRIAARVAAEGLYTRCPLEHRLRKCSHAPAPSTVSCAKHIHTYFHVKMIRRCVYENQQQNRCIRHTWRDPEEYFLMPNNQVSMPFWIQCSTVKAVKPEFLIHTYVLDVGSFELVLPTLVVCRSCLTFCPTKYARLRIE